MEKKESQPVRFAPGSMDHVLSGIDSPEVREKILRIAHESGVQKEDPAWSLILLILEANTSKEWSGKAAQAAGAAADRIRREILGLPKVIITSVGSGMDVAANKLKEAEDKIIEGSKKAIEKAEGEAKKSLANAVNDKVSEAAQNAINLIVNSTHVEALKIQARKWALIGGVIAFGLIGTTAWWSWSHGEKVGYDAKASLNEELRTGWTHFANCDKPGWKIEIQSGKKICFPYSTKDGTYGWRLDDSPSPVSTGTEP
jgi:hypothetical protein